MKSGRSFSRDYSSDSSKVILNEAAVASMGLSDPIGRYLTFWGRQMQIVGVTGDFQHQSLHNSVEPLIMKLLCKEQQYVDEIWRKLSC